MKLRLIEYPRENRETVWMIQTESASGVKEYVYLFMNHLAYAKEDDKLAMSHAEFRNYTSAAEAFHVIKDFLTRGRNKMPKVIFEEEI
jgi:hypothetical protein